MKPLEWFGLAWTELVGLGFTWVNFVGYRDPQANRLTKWLDDYYRSLSGDRDRPGGGAAFSHEIMLQSALIGAVICLVPLAVAVVGLLK